MYSPVVIGEGLALLAVGGLVVKLLLAMPLVAGVGSDSPFFIVLFVVDTGTVV